MNIKSFKVFLKTEGNGEIVNITENVQSELKKSEINDGLLTVFVPGATGALTTAEYEPGLIKDMSNLFKDIVKENTKYSHDADSPTGNAPSHLRASLIGPSLTVPFEKGKLQLGVWQQIVFIDFDNRPRDREIIIKILGE